MNNTLIAPASEQVIKSSCLDLEHLHPHSNEERWFTTDLGGTCNLTKLLVHPQQVDYYQWVSNGINIPRWNAPNKWTPYDMRKLLGRYLPDLFHIYWYSQISKVIQLDVQAIKSGRLAYREMNLTELRSYVTGQIYRIQRLRNPSPDSAIGRVFNSKWFNGDQPFPLYISRNDVENLLTPLIFEDGHVYFSESVLYQGKYPKVMHVKYKLTHIAPSQVDPFISVIEKYLGKEMDSNDLHDLLDGLNFSAGNRPAKIRKLHDSLKPHGIILRRQQKRLNGSRKYFYTFLQATLERVDYQLRDYQSIKNA